MQGYSRLSLLSEFLKCVQSITSQGSNLKKGDCFQLRRSFSQQDVSKFADLSGDDNPLHQSADLTSSTFAQPVVHGIFVASMFSAVIGRNFPGAIYLNQQLKFSAPVFFDEEVTARVTVTRCKQVKNVCVASMETVVEKANGQVAISGSALCSIPAALLHGHPSE
ncbi:hypothetical protein GUITHDRAFT_66124 [Guillardia theta CCMP2712]|uniref:MaoC-like domain-containing protein n=1 Tax=Guillardia theta (strain CCMP2712) TaxID=905079 RepID=L1JSL4_GUITC|nr:hypothetical protein GUITHDRAFT_66124 [Guillardia theta CCMP2712]EKX51078.1 hypothetical protein GUITHDRAFT_66124 [Guillardia theta CCMP2712]|eukprot:XP_005838058.1 hypothetical protein GUITHDRAFT_66124 [Guillardia theta CCMP2712]